MKVPTDDEIGCGGGGGVHGLTIWTTPAVPARATSMYTGGASEWMNTFHPSHNRKATSPAPNTGPRLNRSFRRRRT